MDFILQKKPGRDAPPEHFRSTLLRLYRYMTHYRILFFGMLALMLLTLAADLVIPLAVESAVNAISFADGLMVDFRALTFSIAALVILSVLSALLGCAGERISARITLKMSMNMRQDAFDALMDVSVSSFEGRLRGDLMSRIQNDCELAAGAFTGSFREFASAALILCGCAVIMFVKCAPLAAVSVGTAVVSVICMGLLSGLILPLLSQQQAALGRMNAHVEESMKTFRSCAAGGKLDDNRRLMSVYCRDYYHIRLKVCRLEYLMGPVMLIFGNLSFLLTILFGLRQMAAGVITLGAIQAFIMYSRQFMEPLNSIGEDFIMVQNALAGAERVFAVTDSRNEREEIGAACRVPENDAVNTDCLVFENLHFAYHRNRPVLKGINLTVRKGEHLALVGKTGEGKTTLSSLLLLFYPAYTGRILLEGREIRSLDPDLLRKELTVVSQEPQLVKGTVYENIVCGCGNASRGDVERVLKEMRADEFFANLPHGLDTEIGSAGREMSQGQLQLICLARALLRDSPLLILDESTSSLDPDTEQTIKQGMKKAMSGRTCLTIAHRLSSVKDADHIAVLSGGIIEEYGTHESLMRQNGVYYSLYRTQFLGEEI